MLLNKMFFADQECECTASETESVNDRDVFEKSSNSDDCSEFSKIDQETSDNASEKSYQIKRMKPCSSSVSDESYESNFIDSASDDSYESSFIDDNSVHSYHSSFTDNTSNSDSDRDASEKKNGRVNYRKLPSDDDEDVETIKNVRREREPYKLPKTIIKKCWRVTRFVVIFQTNVSCIYFSVEITMLCLFEFQDESICDEEIATKRRRVLSESDDDAIQNVKPSNTDV